MLSLRMQAGLLAILSCTTATCGAQTPPAGATAAPTADTFYAAAIRAMDRVVQPSYVSYSLEGKSDGIHLGLTTDRHQVWIRFQSGSAPTTWAVEHRTQDYASQVVDVPTGTRYVSQRSIFDPTWFGAFRALRDGMLGYQDVESPRASLTVTQATPTPDPELKTIATVNVIGTSIYSVQDRGAATCANGDPGHALHLVPRRHDPRRQLTDVVVDLRSMRFCSIRYVWNEALWFNGIVEQHYSEVGGYWLVTDGFIDGTMRVFGLPTHKFDWDYRLTNVTFPQSIPASTFVPDSSQ